MRYIFAVLVFFTSISISYAQTQSLNDGQEFHPLDSLLQSSDVIVNVLSEAQLVDHLISDEALSTMEENERKRGYASVYEYSYTIKNTGKVKIKIVFANENVLASPISQIIQDFTITLLPNETKKIKFIANTTPQSTLSYMCIMNWVEEKNKWFFFSYGNVSLYLPAWNALAKEVSD